MIAENIKYLRKKHNWSQQQLAESLGIARTTLGDYERGRNEPNISMLCQLSTLFGYSVDQLVSTNINHEQLEVVSDDKLRVLAITVDANNRNLIDLVETKAEAGYVESFSNPEYIKELPKITVPNIPEGTYRAFEIQGKSMLPMQPGSIVICSYVEDFDHIKEDQTYVVIGYEQGVVYKRLKNNKETKNLQLYSDNRAYLPYEMSYTEVQEVWQHYAHISFDDTQQTGDSKIEDMLVDIQQRLTRLEK